MKAILKLIALSLLLTACGSGGGGSNSPSTPNPTPGEQNEVACVFSGLRESQITQHLKALEQTWSDYKSTNGCNSEEDAYVAFTALFARSLANLQNDELVQRAIANKSLETAVFEIFDSQSCDLKTIKKEQLSILKQCKWSEI